MTNREIDVRIARELLKLRDVEQVVAGDSIYIMGRDYAFEGEWTYQAPDEPFPSILPYFTESVGAAWMVAEKMRKEWADYDIGNDVESPDGGWRVAFGNDGRGWAVVPAETAPLAICRAALLALEMDGDE